FTLHSPPPRSTLFPYTTLFRSSTSSETTKWVSTIPSRGAGNSAIWHLLGLAPHRGRSEGSCKSQSHRHAYDRPPIVAARGLPAPDRKSTRLNSSHVKISYAVFC